MAISRRAYAGRAVAAVLKQGAAIGQRITDGSNSTYQTARSAAGGFAGLIRPSFKELLSAKCDQIQSLAANFVEHRFDLLGSGWVRVAHGVRCRGVERIAYKPGAAVSADHEGRWLEHRINRANLIEARRIWRLIGPAYTPIDWKLDFKSGYRWSEKTWYLDIRYGHKLGADIKVPWELARMQHMAGLASDWQTRAQELLSRHT